MPPAVRLHVRVRVSGPVLVSGPVNPIYTVCQSGFLRGGFKGYYRSITSKTPSVDVRLRLIWTKVRIKDQNEASIVLYRYEHK